MDENRGVFSTDLESDWCNTETMEGGSHTHTQVM